jgi:hypothetical protein
MAVVVDIASVKDLHGLVVRGGRVGIKRENLCRGILILGVH